MTLLSTEARLAKERKRSKDESISNKHFKLIMKIIRLTDFWSELPLYTAEIISVSGFENSSLYTAYSRLKLPPNYVPTIV